ncbi:hypothetical protein Bca4012_084407 [Brassica carinata]
MDMKSVAASFVVTVVIFVFLLRLVATIHVSFIWGIVPSTKSSRLSSHQSASHIRPRKEAFVTHFQRVSQEKRGRLGGESSGCGDDRNKLQSTYRGGHGRAAAENEEMMREKLESGLPVFR